MANKIILAVAVTAFLALTPQLSTAARHDAGRGNAVTEVCQTGSTAAKPFKGVWKAGVDFNEAVIELDFYGKSGFVVAGTRGIRYHGEPEQEIVPYVLLKELRPGFLDGVTGVYHTPKGYYVDEAAAEEFDCSFPPKEKLKLPGQLF